MTPLTATVQSAFALLRVCGSETDGQCHLTDGQPTPPLGLEHFRTRHVVRSSRLCRHASNRFSYALIALYVRVVRGSQRSRFLRLMLILMLNSSAVIAATGGAVTADASAVPICHANNGISAKVTGENGASSTFYFLITLTNDGATTCSLSGTLDAQPASCVASAACIDIGPRAGNQPTAGIPRRAVTIRSRGGKVYVEFYVINEAVWTKSQCGPKHVSALLLRIPGLNGIYVPFSRLGANEVCTRRVSTKIGPLSTRSY